MTTMDIGDFRRSDEFDSRDVLKRIEELTDDREIWVDEWWADREKQIKEASAEFDELLGVQLPTDETRKEGEAAWAEQSGGDDEELADLEAFIEEAEGYSGDSARDGIFFIADSFFEQYAESLAEDIGAINSNAGWPLNNIDWKAAADDLKQDYTEIRLDGRDFWYR